MKTSGKEKSMAMNCSWHRSALVSVSYVRFVSLSSPSLLFEMCGDDDDVDGKSRASFVYSATTNARILVFQMGGYLMI